MKRRDFEAKVLGIWMRSRVPLTLAHVQHLTAAARPDAKKWLDAMTVDGLLEATVADDGEMIWTVRGADRPRAGAETVAELERLDHLSAQVRGAPRALTQLSRAASLAPRGGGDDKSIVASGALSLFLGPLGWLYAAPLKEAIPGVLLTLLATSLIPHVLLIPLLGILAPLSGAAGIYYAWRHNQTGERTGLFSDKRREK
ncbi:MAG TPA: hypothetical protein VFH68_20735 [Polyangia bacterium]|jgi:hypothetical protein|nr:hypothetical protein [Polyangia bacterium]